MRFLAKLAINGAILVAAVHGQQATVRATVRTAIDPPRGYSRAVYPVGSFSDWVQRLPLKPGNDVRLFSGGVSDWGYDIVGVLDMPLLFAEDLEQCADYCMRIWAEYHKATGRLDELYLFDYGGTRKPFAASGKTYRSFLKWAFAYSNSHSLKRGCVVVAEADLALGDMVVQNERGGIGHVSMIVDKCVSDSSEALYLIGYSFMPAQEFHIERASELHGVGGWYTLQGYYDYLAAFLNLGTPVLRRFARP